MASGLKRKAQGTLAKVKGVQENSIFQVQIELTSLKRQIKERNLIQVDLPNPTIHSKKEILELKEFNFRYFDSQHFLFSNPITFQVAGPKRVSIVGPNGSGKSTLTRLLMNSLMSSTRELKEELKNEPLGEMQGTIQLKTNRVAYLDQRLEILWDGKTSLLERFSEKTPHLSESERRIRLGRFLFNQNTVLKKISALSGGEQMRAALACILFSEHPPELLILDEPTNNLDLDSIES